MEGGVPRVEEADSEPKNFHLSKQAGESHRNSESNSMKAPLYSQGREAETPLELLEGQKQSSQRHTEALQF